MTFKKSKELSDIFKDLPLDKIIVETEFTLFISRSFKGKTNEPSHIIHTVKHLARIKGINEEEFSKITSSNFFNLFGKLN